ncbi:MAG: exo-alpha-sialidase [Lentisphaeria bacterium]|nr:exo-alpha-sialidase [Lentisphaeria bacterium]
METVFHGIAGKLCISEPELYVDNESRHRSGHMTHAMVEYEPGKIIDFNSNCSAERLYGHSAFGWIEYRYSEDYGKTWSEIHELPYSKELLIDGVYTISVEKAVVCNGVITLFALRNTQHTQICCEPWATPIILQSYDYGKTWTEPREFSQYEGRIYDAVVKDNVIYVMELCNPNHVCVQPEHLYRLFCSTDNGKTFQERSVIDINNINHAYGALQFRDDGSLVAYACNIPNGFEFDASISYDNGASWERYPTIKLAKGIRNVQISKLGDGYVMHGRGCHKDAPWGRGFVFYTSKDGLNWDEGFLLEEFKTSCYYSNNLLLKEPGEPEKLLVQYSDKYAKHIDGKSVNVMHVFLKLT